MLGRGLVAASCSVALLITVSAAFQSSVNDHDRLRCHNGVRDTTTRCHEYVNFKQDDRVKRQDYDYYVSDYYPPLEEWCKTITWREANRTNNWGNCVEMIDDHLTHRFISANTVPDFFYNPYCPIGIGYGYCIDLEYELGRCMFPNLTCGEDNGAGSGDFGDYWVPLEASYKIPLKGNPTRDDRPGDMYDATTVGAVKSIGAALGVAINGIGIFGPNDAGDISIDEAGFQLACGGHVTPPLETIDPSVFPPGAPAPSPPLYHYHKAPDCLEPYTSDYKGVSRGATPFNHGKLTGWALDGFGIYTFQDVDGLTPIVDECGGHFGPVDETGDVVYHYHTRPFVPYTLACQGPALGKCEETQGRTNYCHYGCKAEVCVQPGTSETKLREYLAGWDEGWLDRYTVNDYSGVKEVSLALTYCVMVAQMVMRLL